jgi:PAS domain S-box-containing protein
MGVGSLLLIFIAAQVTDYVAHRAHEAEDRAISAIENIAQARFEIAVLGVASTRFIESLDQQFLTQSEDLKRRIIGRVDTIAAALPGVAAHPDYPNLLADFRAYDAAFAQATAYERELGAQTTTGLRRAFADATGEISSLLQRWPDPQLLKHGLIAVSEAGRISATGAEFDDTPLLASVDALRNAIGRSTTLAGDDKARALKTVSTYRDLASRFIPAIQKQIEARQALRALSRTTSTHFAGLAEHIHSVRMQLDTEAHRTEEVMDWANATFSALVALAFIVLAGTVGRRMRAQAETISSNEMRFRQLVETMADFAVETDENFIVRHTFTRPSFAPTVDPGRIIGRRPFESIPGELQITHLDQAKLDHFLTTRTPFRDFEYQIELPNGYRGWRRCYGSPFYNERGEFAGFRVLSQDCTAQKESERLRQESDAAYRAIATAAFGAFYRIDNHGRILSLEGTKDQPAAIMNMQRSGRFIWDAFVDLGIKYPDTTDLKDKILRGEEFTDVEVQTFHADGTPRGWYVHRGVPIRDKDGRATGYVIGVANISKQKALEQEARAKAHELERIIVTMPGAFFRLSGASIAGAVIEYVSPRIVDILGYTPDEIIGRPGLDLTAPGGRPSSYFEKTSDLPPLQEKRVQLRRKDGTYATVLEKPVEIATRPDGSRVIEGLLIDISELAQRDMEIADRRRQLEAIVTNLPGWIYGFSFKNGEVNWAFCTGGSQDIIGLTGEEMIELFKNRPEQYVHPDDLAEFKARWRDVQEAPGAGNYESRHRLISADGREIWVSDRGRYTKDADGTIHMDGIILDITAEAAAQRQTEIIKSAVDSASDAICVTNRMGTALYVNDAFRTFFDIPPGTHTGAITSSNTGHFVVPDDKATRAAIDTALASVGRFREEVEWENPSGRRVKLDITVTRAVTGHNVLIARDITAVRAAVDHRNKLNIAAARVGIARGSFLADFRSGIQELTEITANAMEVAQVGVWLFDDERRQSFTSVDVFDRRTGSHSEGTVQRRSDYPLYFAALDLMRNIVAQDAQNDPITKEFAATYLKEHGITGLLDTPIFRGGKVLGVLCIERDGPVRPWLDEEVAFATVIADSIAFGVEAEERKVAERRVVAMNSQLNRVVKALDSSQDNIIIEDESGRVAYLNARARQNSAHPLRHEPGFTGAGLPFAEMFPNFHKRRQEVGSKIQQDLAESGAWEDEIEVYSAIGSHHYMEVRIAQLPDGGLICVATDVTARRRQTERETGLRTQLAEAQKMEAIGRLAGGIAHDFNNIIAAVAAYASVISGDSCSNQQHASYASKIRTICARASDIVKQILLFAKAKTANHDPIVVAAIVNEAQELLTASLPASVDVRVVDNSDNAVVMGANAQLLQVLLNLGLNSGDAIKEEQGYIQIALDRVTVDETDADGADTIIQRKEDGVTISRSLKGSLSPGRSYVRISVRDNGPGIPDDVLERIYEPFFTTKEKSKGSGLGVPVVYSIVTAHDGAIEIRTTLGHGTRFLIYLPLTDEVVESRAEAKPKDIEPRGRILIVDDEADLADAMSILLSKAGFEAAPVYSPRDAIDVFAEDPFAWDLVLTDQVMPEMKGVALAKKLLKLRPGLPIILYTGYSDSASEEVVKAAGIRTLLFKPVEGSLLVQHIAAALKSSAH